MRDCRNEFIQNFQTVISKYLDQETLEHVIADAYDLLDCYELSERVTALVVPESVNTKLIKMYMNSLVLDGKSKKTAYAYYRQLERFNEFTGNKDLKEIGTFDIRNYIAHEKMRGLANVSVENTRTYLNSFFHWMTNEQYIDRNPAEAVKPIKCKKEIKLPFSTVELDSLKNNCKSLKERAIVEVLLSSGVRVSELVALNVEDIDFQAKSVMVRHGKGDKERVTYINDLALNYLVKYLMDAGIESGPLFQSKGQKRYTPAGIRYILNKIAEKADVQNVHPHRFRRTFATSLAARGMEIQDIQLLMGHADINTTLLYITLDNTKVNNSYRKYIA